MIARAAAGLAGIVYIDDRHRVRDAIAARYPDLLLLPLADSRGVTTVPLATQCLIEFPTLNVAMLLSSDSAEHRSITQAIQSGVDVFTTRSHDELRQLFLKITGHQRPTLEEFERIDLLTRELPRLRLAKWFALAVRSARTVRTVRDLCELIHVPRRTLIRHLHNGGWPNPAQLMMWARLVRASMLCEKGIRNARALARAGGFSTVKALRSSALLLLASDSLGDIAATPTTVIRSLRAHIRATPLSTGVVSADA
jgi:hypothetical protein